MLYSHIDNLLSNEGEEYFENQSFIFSPLEYSFSLISSKEEICKNSLEFQEVESLNNNISKDPISKDIEEKECLPAPAPLILSSSLNQSVYQKELNYYNMECPEVVNNQIKFDKIYKKGTETQNKYNSNEYNNKEEKPSDENGFLLQNESKAQPINSIYLYNYKLEKKSAALKANANQINNNNFNSQTKEKNNINSLNISNSALNGHELSYSKDNFSEAPLVIVNNQNIEKVLFVNTKEEKKYKNNNGYVRKLKPDSIRKKIKARFHKKIRQIINHKLKEYGSKFLFNFLPQPFITNINIEFNRSLLKITMRELFQKTFGTKKKDKEKTDYNIKVIKYLEKNPHINNDKNISQFLDSTYEEIIQKYMNNKYLMEEIERLKKEGQNNDYINRYVFIANHWTEFYKQGYI